MDFLFIYLKSLNYPIVPSSVDIFNGLHEKIRGIMSYSDRGPKIKASITLVRAKSRVIGDISENYDLDTYTDGEINVKYLDGSHLTIMQDAAIIDIIKEIDPYNKS